MSAPLTRAAPIAASLVILLALLTALDAMAIDMYLPAMPAIARDLGTSAGRIQQTLSIFLAGLAVGQAIYGPLLDRYGRRMPLLLGVVVFIVGSAMAALATSVEWLLAARFLQALGAAAGLVTPRAIVADVYDLNESSRILSLLMQVMMIGPILAPILGGYLLGVGSWHGIFWAMALLGTAGLFWSMFAIPETLPPAQRTPLALGNVWRAYASLLRHRAFMAYTVAGGLVLGSFFAYLSGAAFIFTSHYDLSATQFSYVFAANSVALVLGGLLSNRLLRLGMPAARAMIAGVWLYALSGLGLAAVALWLVVPWVVYALLLAIPIASLGLVFGNLTAMTMAHAGTQIGVASALMGTLQYLMSALIGFMVSLAPAGLVPLPVTIALCGLAAAGACALAVVKPRR